MIGWMGDDVAVQDRQTRQEFSEWIALEAFVLLAATPVVLAAVFGHLDNVRSIVAVLLVLAGIVAVILRRRAAWALLVLFYGAVLVSYTWEWSSTLLFAVNAAVFVLLVSPPIRRHVAKRRTGALAGSG
jgi:hypothetical protein